MKNVSNVNINRNTGRIFLIIFVVIILIGVVSRAIVYIPPNQAGVVESYLVPGGYRNQPLQSGLHFVVPVVERVIRYSIAKQNYTMSSAVQEGQIAGDDSVSARTSDGQEISVDASVIFKIDPTKVIDVHINWQDRYEQDLVRAQARGIIRDAVSQYRVDEVISTQRENMTQQMRSNMEVKMSDNGLILEDFVLRNIKFSPEYAAAVEQKQVAEQQALQAEFVVEQRKQEAEQARQVAQGQADAAVIAAQGEAEARLIQAEAEASALQYIADVLRGNPALLQYQYITNLAPGVQTIFVPSDNQFILPLPETATQPTPVVPITPTETP